jgi:hypothetical protein
VPLLTLQSAKGYGFGSLVAAADAASDMELISSTTLGSSQSSVSFSSLNTSASAYRHLRIVALVRAASNSTAQSITLELNGSSASNYNAHSFYTFVSSTVVANSWLYANTSSSNAFCGGAEGLTAYSNAYQPNIYEFHDFSQTDKNKYITAINGCIVADNNGSVAWNNVMWNQTSAITSITFTLATNFAAGSRFTLYGIK